MISDKQRAWHLAHREEKRAYDHAYNAAHREERAAYGAAYYAAHRDEAVAYNRARHAAKREEINAARRGSERARESARAWAAANRGKVREAKRRDYARHSEAYKRRARTVGLNGEQVRVAALPTEWQPVAWAIREARLEIRTRGRSGREE